MVEPMSVFTPNQRRAIARRRVGRLDDGRVAFLVRPGDTREMAVAILENYEPERMLEDAQVLVDWCMHSADYAYNHGCLDWCQNPTSALVWVGSYSEEYQ